MFFCFMLGRRMDVPEEETEEKTEVEEEESGRGEECEEEEEGQEEVRRGLSHKRYVSSCIIEDTSLTFYLLFISCLQMDER